MSELLNQYKKASNENYKLRAKLDKERGENVKLEIINEKNCLVTNNIISSLNNKLQIAVEGIRESLNVLDMHDSPVSDGQDILELTLEKIKELG